MKAGRRLPVLREWLAVMGTWCVGAFVFFHQVLSSGFERLTGDPGDARLITLLHEHWLEVLRGNQSWRSPNFFHPLTNTLGLSDTFVLDEVLYAPLRLIGLDRYLATQWMLILMSLIGFVGCYRVCSHLIGVQRGAAIACAYVFTFANNLAIHAGHLQLFSVYWVPLIILVGARMFNASTRRSQSSWAALTGLLLGLLVYSTFYIGWFTLLAATMFTLRMTVHLRTRLPERPVRTLAIRCWRPIAAGAAGVTVVMVPFAFTYLPTLDRTGGRSFNEVAALSPTIAELFNVGDKNVVWGPLLTWLSGDAARLRNVETSTAITPLLFAAIVVCAALIARRCKGDTSVRTAAARSLLTVALIFIVLPVRISNFSLWRAVWMFVPGARALRAIDRIQIVTGLLAVLAIATSAVVLGSGERGPTHRTPRLLLVAGLLLAFEQWNVGHHAQVHHRAEVALIRDAPKPPTTCHSFVILPTEPTSDVVRNIDAMIIAQTWRLPTANGYSGGTPAFWDLAPSAENYVDRVRRWSRYHSLTDVCAYDPAAHSWATGTFT